MAIREVNANAAARAVRDTLFASIFPYVVSLFFGLRDIMVSLGLRNTVVVMVVSSLITVIGYARDFLCDLLMLGGRIDRSRRSLRVQCAERRRSTVSLTLGLYLDEPHYGLSTCQAQVKVRACIVSECERAHMCCGAAALVTTRTGKAEFRTSAGMVRLLHWRRAFPMSQSMILVV